ncbi:hypothetical protein [Blautia sp.]|uniref:hypothetical protein n=1 Tax=Blautia sp. TaxID=1955243 RepID=UPI002E776F4A|nr:hypothetical protein [Blautia sp.]MEE0642876.1 hypothetical protein [Blautia sp.]
MDKKNLIKGKTYLRKHSKPLRGRYGTKEVKLEGYIEFSHFIPGKTVFFQSGNELELSDEEVEKEVSEI